MTYIYLVLAHSKPICDENWPVCGQNIEHKHNKLHKGSYGQSNSTKTPLWGTHKTKYIHSAFCSQNVVFEQLGAFNVYMCTDYITLSCSMCRLCNFYFIFARKVLQSKYERGTVLSLVKGLSPFHRPTTVHWLSANNVNALLDSW